ncbi:9328_t:CDS:10 [Ambispora leptoticha]|uniref:9328_t:CDS:1 n=1 Tax=Ambispora leptoticha TaxID=144679 RepID=A0A9N9FHZ7_9GLOM|nr:9328_t:CDS:10 [Ambispora leptoticha]
MEDQQPHEPINKQESEPLSPKTLGVVENEPNTSVSELNLDIIRLEERSRDASFNTENMVPENTADDSRKAVNEDTHYENHSYPVYSFDFSKPWELVCSTKEIYCETVHDTLGKLFPETLKDKYNQINGWEDNFFKMAKWSPDGTYTFRRLTEFALIRPLNVFETIEEIALNPVIQARTGETIYDCCWYPMMSSQEPETCCFLSSSRDHPIHLWDAFSGKIRASYTIIDHREQIIGPNSLAFNLDGSRIYCGYNNMIEIFDSSRPGRGGEKHPTTPTRKSKDGQKAFNPDYSGLYAAGSYSRTVGLYDEKNNKLLYLLRDLYGGVTQIKFSSDGYYLFSASRRDNFIHCWDIRNTGDVLFKLNRIGDTNQRLMFDIDASGRYLITGDQNGKILIYNISNPTENIEDISRLIVEFSAHNDTTSAAAFHPTLPLMVSCSGQRKFDTVTDMVNYNANAFQEGKEASLISQSPIISSGNDNRENKNPKSDNSLKIWKIEQVCEWYYPTSAEAACDV